jgi:hypothetical protein
MEWPPQVVVMGPKSLSQINIGGPTLSHLSQMAQNRADGYVFGVAYYDDVFKASSPALSAPSVSIFGVSVIAIAHVVLRKDGCDILISSSAKCSSHTEWRTIC